MQGSCCVAWQRPDRSLPQDILEISETINATWVLESSGVVKTHWSPHLSIVPASSCPGPRPQPKVENIKQEVKREGRAPGHFGNPLALSQMKAEVKQEVKQES